MKLNGWKRVWIVFTVFSGLLSCGLVIFLTEASLQSEDLNQHMANLLGNAKVVNIKLFGNVQFPAQLPEEEISRIVKEGLSTSPAAVKEAAEKEFMKIAWQLVDQARAENEMKRLKTYLFSSLIWIGAVTFIYLFGWSVAWVRRGFDDY